MVDNNIPSLSPPPQPPLQPPPPPPPHYPPKPNMPMLYYGLVVVGTAAIVLAIYNLIIIKWCSNGYERQSRPNNNRRLIEVSSTGSSQSFENPCRFLLTSYKYKKENNNSCKSQGDEVSNIEYECAVCLSFFEDGEEVKQLPRCKHSFHAPCIDMWLYSHYDCPLCRATVNVTRSNRHRLSLSENSREGLLDSSPV